LNYFLSRFVVEEVNLRTLKAECSMQSKGKERREKGERTGDKGAESREEQTFNAQLRGKKKP